MELTRNSAHYSFYKFWWKKIPPNDLCNYFWGLLLAVVTLPLFLGRCWYEMLADHPESSNVITKTIIYVIWTFVAILVAIFLGLLIAYSIAYWETTLTVIGSIAGFVALIGLWFFLGDKFEEPINMTNEFIKSKKSKVCPRINWK